MGVQRKETLPRSLLLPPALLQSLHLTDYECVSEEGRSDGKKSQNRRKHPNHRRAWSASTDSNAQRLLHTDPSVWSLRGRHTLHTTSPEAGLTLGRHTLCKHRKRPFSVVTHMQTYREAEITETGLAHRLPLSSLCSSFTHISAAHRDTQPFALDLPAELLYNDRLIACMTVQDTEGGRRTQQSSLYKCMNTVSLPIASSLWQLQV